MTCWRDIATCSRSHWWSTTTYPTTAKTIFTGELLQIKMSFRSQTETRLQNRSQRAVRSQGRGDQLCDGGGPGRAQGYRAVLQHDNWRGADERGWLVMNLSFSIVFFSWNSFQVSSDFFHLVWKIYLLISWYFHNISIILFDWGAQ